MSYINGNEILFSSNVNITEGGGVKEYSETETYNKGDIVSYNGSLYTPLADGTLGIEPTLEAAWQNLIANSGGSTTYGYVPVCSPYYLNEDFLTEVNEEMLELHKKALWYKVRIRTKEYEYGNVPITDYIYETEGLFFPRKNMAETVVLDNDTLNHKIEAVEGVFIPSYFKRGALDSTPNDDNIILLPLKATMMFADHWTVDSCVLQVHGSYYEPTGMQRTEIMACSGEDWQFEDNQGVNAAGRAWFEAYVPVDDTVSNYSLRQDYTELELQVMEQMKARSEARKAREAEATN